jgi:hypothetical protein
MFFYVLQLVETRFGAGIGVAKQWAMTGLRIAGALVIFLALRFLVGQWLRIYPVDTHQMWGTAGGVKGLFWGHAAESALIWELLFAFVAGGLVYLWSRGKARKLVAMVFVGSFIIVTLQLMFPMWAQTWPNRNDIDEALTKKGLVGTIAEPLKALRGKDYPICVETQDGVELSLKVKPQAELQLSPDCWSGWVVLPEHARFRVRSPGDMEYLFLDGRRLFVSGKEWKWLGELKTLTFRLRGEGMATIAVEPQPRA